MKQLDIVIIVEDDFIASMIIEDKIESHPLITQSKTFANGKLSIDYIKSTFESSGILPDLVLLDINMPVMNGWEFLDAFYTIEKLKEVPVIMLTSSINPQDIEKAKSYKEVKGYFLKPLTTISLDAIIALVQ